MPIYEFVCQPCGEHFEKLQKSDASEDNRCPKCGSSDVKKQLSAFSASAGSPSTSCHSGG